MIVHVLQSLALAIVFALGILLGVSVECGRVVEWLRSSARCRDDGTDPEWVMALASAADFIEDGEHRKRER